jgi:hypothetical protein
MVTELQIPIRSQLGTLIFEKAMRRKNVKAAIAKDKETEDDKDQSKDDAAPADQNGGSTNNADGEGDGPSKPNDEGAGGKIHETDQQSRQAVINLMGVDARRVSNFNLMAWLIPTSVARLHLVLGLPVGVDSHHSRHPVGRRCCPYQCLCCQEILQDQQENDENSRREARVSKRSTSRHSSSQILSPGIAMGETHP